MTAGNKSHNEAAISGTDETTPISQRIGFLSPWNQHCGLATYGRFLVEQLLDKDVIVLSERTEALTREDEDFVRRCWERAGLSPSAGDYYELARVIEQEALGLLHINCQSRFFVQPNFSHFLSRIRAAGVKVVVHLHNVFTATEELQLLVAQADRVLVHSAENRLEVIANGCAPERGVVVPHGVVRRVPRAGESKERLRRELGLPVGEALLMAFGFIQPHKGMEALLDALLHLKNRGISAHGVIVGQTRSDDPQSAAYLRGLKDVAQSCGLSERLSFVTSFVSDERVGDYLAASDLVVMNYRSQHFEASGACSLAVGAGATVMTSLAPAMMGFGDAVWHMTAGYSPGLSAELLLTNPELKAELSRTAADYCDRHSWPRIAEQMKDIYGSLGVALAPRQMKDSVKGKETSVSSQNCTPSKKIRVLMQNRPNTFTQRGGDTVVLEKLRDGLREQGVDVTVDVDAACEPMQFDLVHLFNFATVDYTRELAKRAHAVGVPFVVTTLFEDLPQFHNQSHAVAERLVEYVLRGQDRAWWGLNTPDISAVAKSQRFQSDWAAQNAAALYPNGSGEARVLTRDFPQAKSIVEVPVGHEVGALSTSEAFEKEFGVKDFVLCVGRIESRKNQLMLLKALEDSELTVVLAAGGFSYQPDYERAVRSFKRKGKTIILDRVSPEMLSSAYAAARIHVLPSWYELPGLVSLEAAAHGKNIVVTRTGTTADYVGDRAFYCLPWSEDSISAAVQAAYYAPVKSGLQEMARAHTWQKTVDATLESYRKVLGVSEEVTHSEAIGMYDMSMNATEFQDALEGGELAAKNMDFEAALRLLHKAESMDGNSARVHTALGAVHLAQSRTFDARSCFDRALAIDPNEVKALTGRGMCDAGEAKHKDALQYLRRALNVAPNDLVALYQFMGCSYACGNLDELRQVLERYLAVKGDDNEVRYCYAGCLFKQGQLIQAQEQLTKVLEVNPEHSPSIELGNMLRQRLGEKSGAVRSEGAMEQSPPAVTAHVDAVAVPKSAVPSNALQESLSELSNKIAMWKVKAEAPRQETLVREIPQVSLSQGVPNTSAVAVVEQSAEGRTRIDEALEKVEELKHQQRFEEARKELGKITSNPTMNIVQSTRARCLEAEFMVLAGDLQGAGAMYEAILAANSSCTRAMCGKGALLADRQEWAEAKAIFERALAIEPGYDVALAGLGLCAMVGNQAKDAFDLFMQATRRNPENRRAMFGVMQLGYPLQRFSEMEEMITAYLELHPASIDMLYSLAGVLFKQGKVCEARMEVEKILLFEPQNEKALELHKIIQDKQGVAIGVM